jgi:UDP-N-acetylmuramoyl-L-alanyl-D-glutamate--2,6-diaminopimelate ligase
MIQRLKNLAHLILAVVANVINGFPGKKIRVIGVTGTDGKTTTSSLIYHILQTSGHKAALVTTVGSFLDGKMKESALHVTTPSSFAIQKFLKQAVDGKHEFAVIETSSHGIDQNRIWGIPYEIAAITNVTHEHLDYHPSFEHYAATKLKLLNMAKTAVINLDDPTVAAQRDKVHSNVVTYSLENESDFNLRKYPFQTKLFGSFNQLNCLAAIAVCKKLGISDEQIKAAIITFQAPPGRQEIIYDQEFKIMVDFAHTPNSIENILKEVKKLNPHKIVHVFGAPGLRDQTKRPLMAEASSKYSDVIVLTMDDPDKEDLDQINTQVKAGLGKNFEPNKNFFEIKNRTEAIKFAVENAQPGDFIVLTGKGHQPTLTLPDQELPWNEKEIALSSIKK